MKFRHIYALIMLGVTLILGFMVLNLLVIAPTREVGSAPQGNRMDELDLIEDFWLREAEDFALTFDEVEEAELFWNGGPVVFMSLRFNEDTRRRYARQTAREVMEYFIEASDEVALQYDLQVVIYRDEILYTDNDGERSGVLVDNQAAVVRHVHENTHAFVEATLDWAERYPNHYNFNRAEINVNGRLQPSILEVVGEEGLADMLARLEAIEVVDPPLLDDEGVELELDEENEVETNEMPRYPGEFQISQSSISSFPNWGTWNNSRNRIIWNP